MNCLRPRRRGTAVTMRAALPFTRPPMAIIPSFHRTSVISAKFQRRHRRSPRNDPDDDSDKMGGVGFAVLTAMESGRSQRKGDSSDFPLPGTLVELRAETGSEIGRRRWRRRRVRRAPTVQNRLLLVDTMFFWRCRAPLLRKRVLRAEGEAASRRERH